MKWPRFAALLLVLFQVLCVGMLMAPAPYLAALASVFAASSAVMICLDIGRGD